MRKMAVIRSLARQLVRAGKEMQIISNELESMCIDSDDVVDVYNTLLMQELEKAQFAVLLLTERLIGEEDETETNKTDGEVVLSEGELSEKRKGDGGYGQLPESQS